MLDNPFANKNNKPAPPASGGVVDIESFEPPAPYMAKGEDKNGNPYYGSGIKGYATKMFAKIFDPSFYDQKPSKEKTELIERGAEVGEDKLNDAVGWDKWIGKWTGISAEDVSRSATALRLTGAEFDENGELKEQSNADKAKSFIQAGATGFYKGTGQIVQAGLDVLGLADVASRKYQTTLLAMDDGGGSSVLPDITRYDDGTKFGAVLNTILRLTPPVAAYNALRFFTNGKTISENFKTIKTYNKGSAMVYTMYWDEAKKQEYIRRAQAGENTDLLTRELELPFVELAGSIAGDPTTYLGMGIIGDIGKAKTAIKIPFTQKVLFNVPWRTVGRVPGLSEIFHLGVGRNRLMNSAKLFTEIATPELAQAAKVLETAPSDTRALEAIKTVVTKTQETIAKMGDDYGFFSPVSTAKADLMRKTVGTVFRSVAGAFRDGDDIGELAIAAKALTRKANGGAFSAVEQAAQADAFTTISKYGNMFLSEAGMRTLSYLGKLDDEIKLGSMLEKYGDDLGAMIPEIEATLYKVVGDSFPSVDDMYDAVELEKAALKLGELPDLKIKALAEKYKKLPEYTKISNKAFKLIAENKVYSGMQSFFAGTYMGLSPAYAMRNLQSNAVHIWHDLGTKAAVESVEAGLKAATPNVLGKVNANLSGEAILDDILKLEGDKIAKVTGGAIPTSFGGGIGQAGQEGFGALAQGQRIEKAQAAVALRHIVESETEKMLRYGFIPEVTGLPPEAGQRLKQLTLDNFGNVKDAIKQFRKEVAKGEFETWRSLEVDPQFKDWLRKANVWGEVDDIRKTAATSNEFIEKMQGVVKKMQDMANRVRLEPAMVADTNPMGEATVLVERAFADAGTAAREEVNQFKALTQYWDDLRVAYSDVSVVMRDKIVRLLPEQELGKFQNDFEKISHKFNEVVGTNRNLATDYYTRTKSPAWKKSTPAELWDTVKATVLDADGNIVSISMKQAFPDIDPNQLSKHAFETMAWRWIKDTQSKFWKQYNQSFILKQDALLEQAAGTLGTTLDDLKIQTFQGLDNPKLARVGELQQRIKEWENYISPKALEPFKNVPKGTTLSQMDLSTVALEGGKTRLFNAVNKDRTAKGFEAYQTMDDVPFEEAVTALKGRLKNNPAIAEAGAQMIKQATNVPRSELPEVVSSRIADEAKRLMSELSGGEAGKKTAAAITGSTNVPWYREAYEKGMRKPQIDAALEKIIKDKGSDKGVNVERMKEIILDNFKFGDSASGTPPDLYVLQQLGADEKTIVEALDNFNDITKGNFTLEEALAKSGAPSMTENAVEVAQDANAAYFDDAGELVQPPVPPRVDSTTPTIARQIYENMNGGGADAIQQFITDTVKKWGETTPVSNFSDEAEAGISKFAEIMTKRKTEINAKVLAIADETRNFMFHDYQKTYADKFFGTFLQYHYWTSRTYLRWAERAIDTPGTISAYSKWKDTMDKVHADMPEYYRYQVPIGKLPGMDNSPMYFNLEQTLNPLNSLTGVDYNDPYKRADWASATVDDLGKNGFSLFTPIQWLMAANLYRKGEDEAAQRWMGRLIPATQTLKAGLNKIEGATGLDITPDIAPLPGVQYGELDPFVNIFGGGMDPSEEKRVGRAMAQLIKEGVPKEQAFDALLARDGELYDKAVSMAIDERGTSQIASYFLGLGYKKRTEGDMMVEDFYNKYYKLVAMRDNISPDQYRDTMDALKEEFPFADAILLSKRGGDERDGAYAFNVISRIPPGMSDDLLSSVGIEREIIERFYQDKGDFSEWSEQDKSRFMSAVLDLGAMLKMPDGATKQEWNEARDANEAIYANLKTEFGDDIWDKVNAYYELKDTNQQLAFQFREAHPEITGVLSRRQELLMNDPKAFEYFGSIDGVENYFNGRVRAQLKEEFGDLAPNWAEYFDIKLTDPAAAKQYWNAHPELKAYSERKAELEFESNQAYVSVASRLPEREYLELRPDFEAMSAEQENLANQLQNPAQMPTWDEVKNVAGNDFSPSMQMLIQAYYNDGTELSKGANSQLEYLASRYGAQLGADNPDAFLRMLGVAMYKQNQPADPNQWANPTIPAMTNPFGE